jgi:hypothetical protein
MEYFNEVSGKNKIIEDEDIREEFKNKKSSC